MISLIGKDITAGYGGVDIIKNVNLYVNEGEIVVIVGPNGAGKSTLIKIIAGNYLPTTGKIFINNNQVYFNKPIDAQKKGIEISDPDARKHVYGMPYDEWKTKYRK